MHFFAGTERGVDLRLGIGRQKFFGFTGLHQQDPRVFIRQRRQTRLFADPAKYALVKIVATECRIAAGRQHLEHALGQLQYRDIEGAATQVIHRIVALRLIVETVSNRSCGRLAQQP